MSRDIHIGSSDGLDTNARYAVKGYEGIAFYLLGYEAEWEPGTMFVEDPETGQDVEVESDHPEDGSWVDRKDRVVVVMVGDDRKHVVDIEDLTPLKEGDYCPECGQTGCPHGALYAEE